MTDTYEIDWLAERRPAGVALDEGATLRARAALLEDMTPRAPRRRRRPALARLAVGAVAAGGIAAVVLTTGGSPTSHGTPAGVPSAEAAPLVRLSSHLHAQAAADPALPGDATLVVRHTAHPGKAPTDGADLFGDDGTYYYSDSVSGLPAAIASVKRDDNPADDWAFAGRDVKAAEAAFDGPLADAKQRMADAELTPGATQAGDTAALDAKVAALEAAGKKVTLHPLSATEQQENRIWSNSMNALQAGAGKPAVRAGVLHLLSTISAVTVTKATENGRDVLTLTDVFPRDGYTEALTIDAATGMPIRFSGGDRGATPSVTIAYDVSRVTVADVAKG